MFHNERLGFFKHSFAANPSLNSANRLFDYIPILTANTEIWKNQPFFAGKEPHMLLLADKTEQVLSTLLPYLSSFDSR